jgi:hypothetical protein
MELERCPWPLLIEVLDFRAYARMRARMEQDPDEYPMSDLADLVRKTQARLGREMLDAWG